MASLLDEAREIIELSISADRGKADFGRKAQEWLDRFSASQAVHEAHDHDASSCETCGFDLVCPSCGGETAT